MAGAIDGLAMIPDNSRTPCVESCRGGKNTGGALQPARWKDIITPYG